MSVIDTLKRNLRQHHLLTPTMRLVVAVSGGTDSLALLHALNTLRIGGLDIELHVATLDHGLRGDESKADAEFVLQIAESLGLSVTVRQTDINILAAEQHLSIETAGRKARYDFLAYVAHSIGATTIMTAHHADDQAETVLMHILRGAGLRGLSGMAFQSTAPGHDDLFLLRPFLNITRAELEAYCAENNLVPRQDATNLQTDASRNYIRLKVLPFLKTLNPKIPEALTRLSSLASVDQDFIETQYHHIVMPHIHEFDGYFLIDREAFRRWHPALQRRCIQQCTERLSSFGETISYDRILAIVELGQIGQVGAIGQMPGKIQLRVDYETLVLETLYAHKSPTLDLLLPTALEIEVKVPGITVIPNTNWLLRIEDTPQKDYEALLAFPFRSRVLLRSRRPGDTFMPQGMDGHHRKIKEWMIDRKIPRYIRDRVPLLIINDEIAAVLYGEKWPVSIPYALNSDDLSYLYFFTDSSEFSQV
ncbi:MAG: tRNA lysidine(34) synthetase TilS [Chitinophagaceae bacterium]|nr:tRNA lysidine(34) synthetase TilS [Anaerolineae bacterium]